MSQRIGFHLTLCLTLCALLAQGTRAQTRLESAQRTSAVTASVADEQSARSQIVQGQSPTLGKISPDRALLLRAILPFTRLWHDSSKAVGLGGMAQTSKMSIEGNMSVGRAYGSTAAPADGMIVQGKVGIGTSNPAEMLHVRGPSPVRILGDTTTLSGAESVDFFARSSIYNSDLGGMRIQRQDNGNIDTLFFAALNQNAAAEVMRVGGNGNVGIGVSTPVNGKLVVQASAGAVVVGTALTYSTDSIGVSGAALGGKGVNGASDSGTGVFGSSSSGVGVYGLSTNGNDGVVGEARVANRSGVYGFTTHGDGCGGCFENRGGGTNRALGVTGNAFQSRDGGGMVKAMVVINPFKVTPGNFNAAITYCYNSQATGSAVSTPPCGFTYTRSQSGAFIQHGIDFGFYIQDRFMSLTPYCWTISGGCSYTERISADIQYVVGNNVTVRIYGLSGNDADSIFYLIVF
jgi:hypothetical protein